MICKRCQRSLRSSEGLKCATCESKFHLRCVSEFCPQRESGDRGYQWKCALCQNFAGKSDTSEPSRENVSLLQAINSISEKFELVNKIQLPKLNTDLVQIKVIADRIAKQNDDILRKIHEIEEKRKNEAINKSSPTLRKRNVSFSPKSNKTMRTIHDIHSSFPEKIVRYRTRKQSHLWHKIYNILNRKEHKRRSPRKLKI